MPKHFKYLILEQINNQTTCRTGLFLWDYDNAAPA